MKNRPKRGSLIGKDTHSDAADNRQQTEEFSGLAVWCSDIAVLLSRIESDSMQVSQWPLCVKRALLGML